VKPKVSTAPLPEFLEPMQAKLVASRPMAGAWIYEIKVDGYRALALRDGAEIRILSRTKRISGKRYPTIVDSIAKFAVEDAIIDNAACGIVSMLVSTGVNNGFSQPRRRQAANRKAYFVRRTSYRKSF
jgi:ATP-dependent DNA ligase